jgi:hypothetical protein
VIVNDDRLEIIIVHVVADGSKAMFGVGDALPIDENDRKLSHGAYFRMPQKL